MTQKDYILQELKELDSLLAMTGTGSTYQVPEGYFNTLPAIILTRARAIEAADAGEELLILSPLLAGIPKKMPYSIPAGYFEELEQTPYASIFGSEGLSAEKELDALSPLLGELKKENTYRVPEGYFDTLVSEANENKVTVTKVVSIRRTKWVRYAAAAVVTAVVAVSSFFIISKNKQPDPETASYAWVEKNMKKVSTTDIDEFLQLTDEASLVSTNTQAPIEEVKNLLKNISDDEIQHFLNDAGLDDSDDDILN